MRARLSALEMASIAPPRSASPVVPPNVSDIPTSGFVAALGTYDAKGLTTTFDCALADAGTSIGASIRAVATRSVLRGENKRPPCECEAKGTHGGCQRCVCWLSRCRAERSRLVRVTRAARAVSL